MFSIFCLIAKPLFFHLNIPPKMFFSSIFLYLITLVLISCPIFCQWCYLCKWTSTGSQIQWWPIEMRRQKCLLLCTTNHWHYENKLGTIKKKLQEMQKFFLIFPKLLDFRAFFEKSVLLENGYPLDLPFQCISMRKPSWKFYSKILTGFKFEKAAFSKRP